MLSRKKSFTDSVRRVWTGLIMTSPLGRKGSQKDKGVQGQGQRQAQSTPTSPCEILQSQQQQQRQWARLREQHSHNEQEGDTRKQRLSGVRSFASLAADAKNGVASEKLGSLAPVGEGLNSGKGTMKQRASEPLLLFGDCAIDDDDEYERGFWDQRRDSGVGFLMW